MSRAVPGRKRSQELKSKLPRQGIGVVSQYAESIVADVYIIDCAVLWPAAPDIEEVAQGLVSIIKEGDMRLFAGNVQLGTIERVETLHGQVHIYTRLLANIERGVYEGGKR